MYSVKTTETTRELGKPQNWDDSQGICDSLPIKDEIIAGSPAMTSVWELTDEERALIVSGGQVHLTLLSAMHPPVMLWIGVNDLLEANMNKSEPFIEEKLQAIIDDDLWPMALICSNIRMPESDNNYGRAATLVREAIKALNPLMAQNKYHGETNITQPNTDEPLRKIKTLEWVDHGKGDDSGRVLISLDTIPQMFYAIRKIWDETEHKPCFRIEFSHGYVSSVRGPYGEKVAIVDTVEEGKAKAQEHFIRYISTFFLTE